MKNIHLLPTEKPSRLVKIYSDIERNNFTIKLDAEVNDSFKEYVNIYITSDEEIKEGDWCYQVELNDNKVDKCYDITLYHTWTNNGSNANINVTPVI